VTSHNAINLIARWLWAPKMGGPLMALHPAGKPVTPEVKRELITMGQGRR
jgi:hypothetical protein